MTNLSNDVLSYFSKETRSSSICSLERALLLYSSNSKCLTRALSKLSSKLSRPPRPPRKNTLPRLHRAILIPLKPKGYCPAGRRGEFLQPWRPTQRELPLEVKEKRTPPKRREGSSEVGKKTRLYERKRLSISSVYLEIKPLGRRKEGERKG